MRRMRLTSCVYPALAALAWFVGGSGDCLAQYCAGCDDFTICDRDPGCDCGSDCDLGSDCNSGCECAAGRRHTWQSLTGCQCCCQHHGWDGKRRISYQQQKDLFYNYYAQPGPFYNNAAQMYVSPLPVPANVGHTYTSYQPFMPHEYTYRHQRSYYTYNRGSGWTRTNVRYGTCCNPLKGCCADWNFPMSNNIAAVHNDFFYPYRR